MPDTESELDRLDPQPVTCKMSTGLQVEVVRLRTRQFFRLLRVLTHGAGPAMMQAGLDFRESAEDFTQKFLMLVVMSIPDAETEAIAFLQSMLKPAGLADKPESQQTKQEKEDNAELWKQFNTDLFNPDLDDTLELIETIVRQEAPELQALGKKLQRALSMFRATGQDKGAPEPEASQEEMAASSEPSPPPSTSSATSTDGPTSTSSSSRSAGSARPSRRRAPASSGTATPG
jgi:hypothetical protein